MQVVDEYGAIALMFTGTVVVGGKKSNVITPGTILGLGVRQGVILALRLGKGHILGLLFFSLCFISGCGPLTPVPSHLFLQHNKPE